MTPAAADASAHYPRWVHRAFRMSVVAAFVLSAATGSVGATAAPHERVTVIGDSSAAAIEYEPTARTILARGIDLDLQIAVCRRLVDNSCPYKGSRPPTLVALLPSIQLGSTVVVAVGYNDSEDTFSESVETTLKALGKAGVVHILWLTLRSERQSYIQMNDVIRAAAAHHPGLTVVDWNAYSRSHQDWFQPDGLHLTDSGATAMATLVHRSLDRLGLVAVPPVRGLEIATTTLPTARVGHRYSTRLSTRGGVLPVRWARALGQLPAGLVLRPGGTLEGVPRAPGWRAIMLRATDVRNRSVTRRFRLIVAP